MAWQNSTRGHLPHTGIALTLTALLTISACGQGTGKVPGRATTVQPTERPNQILPVDNGRLERRGAVNPERNAYFGDLHVHTAYSFDAFTFGTTATPYDAYRFAQGQPLQHPLGFTMQLHKPLDFYAVTDHGAFLGVAREAADTSSAFSKHAFAEPLHNLNDPDNMGITTLLPRGRLFGGFRRGLLGGLDGGDIELDEVTEITRRTWADTVRAADQFNTPGKFTTFVAYEYTSRSNDRGNLHRNVVFRGSDRLPAAPFSSLNSQNPEGLWDWMDTLRAEGIESLAIPHNSNASNGQMFKLEDWAGNPLDDDYATQRMRNEPLVEITQVKGTSETHPLLSDTDEWANFEIMPFRISTRAPSDPPGGYVRDAYLRGMSLQSRGVLNPYKFGLIGSSDTHVAASSEREETFHSKSGLLDGEARARGSIPLSFVEKLAGKIMAPAMLQEVGDKTYLSTSAFETWGASGLAAVWAEENTREAIYDAFRRKETFATSGPRIRLRFFAGLDFTPELLERKDMLARAYAGGVTMGSDLRGDGERAPGFLAWASADESSAPLQRLQVIKGYTVDGEHREKIFDVACAGGVAPDPQSHRCPDNSASVNLEDCSISAASGDAQLLTLWQDPEFDPAQEAFYYLRALENPSCRWSTWDALRAGVEPREDLPATLQERAWSSPIWYLTE